MAFGRGIAITSHDIVTRAMHATRSEDFGDMSWSEPLEVLTRSLDREARLTNAGRKLARNLLVDLLVARRHAVAAAAAAAAAAARPRAFAALDGALAVSAAAAAADGPAADDVAWLDLTFLSLALEERWHVPSYAEWLASTDVAGPIARTLAVVDPPVTAGALLLEHLSSLAAVGVSTEVVPCELAAAVDATARRSVELRRSTSDDVDPDKVTRYWTWRLGMVDERSRAGSRSSGGDRSADPPDDAAARHEAEESHRERHGPRRGEAGEEP